MTGLALTSNADQLGRDIIDAGAEIADVADVMRAEGQATLVAAEIPRRTGRLEESAAVLVTSNGFALTATAPYAPFVHAVDPFFTRALTRRQSAITDALEQHTEGVLNRIGD